jgi:hypothetical protein
MVMEFLGGGDLYDFIHSDAEIDWRKRISLASDIAAGRLVPVTTTNLSKEWNFFTASLLL